MSNFQGHAVGASAFGIVYIAALYYFSEINVLTQKLSWFEHVPLSVPVMIICVLFGLWPDIDTNSKGQDIFFRLFFVLDVLLILTGSFQAAAFMGLLAMLPILGKHRGWTHTHWAMVVVPLPFLLVPFIYNPAEPWSGAIYYGAAVAGYASHLVFDGIFFRMPRFKRRRKWYQISN